MKFELQFDRADIPGLAALYVYEDDSRVLELGERARDRGWFTRDEFIEICDWKSPRIRPRVARNTPEQVERVTRSALAATDEVAAIAVLRLLYGVDWAVGSVFLHLGHRDPYPILDYRALEALGVARGTPESLDMWLGYVDATRSLARETGQDMRTVDRALWQWSKERDVRPAKKRQTRRSKARAPVLRHVDRDKASSGADVIILGCVSSKRRGRARAKDLYISALWEKRRAFAEAAGRPWVIYSAKHGILDPEETIEWYDVALAKLPVDVRRRKGEEAAEQLARRFGDLRGKTFEIHAGSAYAMSLLGPLHERGATLVNRLEGLSIGYQLQWYGLHGR